VEDLIFMAKPSKLIGGTMTLFHSAFQRIAEDD
jgi:hypothetical protein